MKMLAVLFVLLTQQAFAWIPNSKLEPRHQTVIAQAIINKCFHFSEIEERSSRSEMIQIDQGIRDYSFISEYQVRVWVDQGLFDDYRVIVQSYYADHYDHQAQNWGHYSVESVKCDLI